MLYSVGQFACRKLCKANIKTGGGSTKGLHTHLHAKHDISVLKHKDDGSGNTTAATTIDWNPASRDSFLPIPGLWNNPSWDWNP